jgi:phenylalanine-4-hydroxylase
MQCYWHSVEFGLCSEDGQPKAYGAGLLSSFGELEYACGPSGGPEYKEWDPEVAAFQEFPITTYQPVYFVTPSIQYALEQMQDFGNRNIHRPFHATYDPETERIHVDRPIVRTPVE